MAAVGEMPYRVIVLVGSGHDRWFASAAAALEYAGSEMDRLLLEHEDLGAQPFDGIFCECRDTSDTCRYEVIRGVPMWVADDDEIRHGSDEHDWWLHHPAANRSVV